MSKRDFPDTLFVSVDPNADTDTAARPPLLAHRSAEEGYDEPVGTTMEMAVYTLERIIKVRSELKNVKSAKP